jgi:transcriptional regulator with XRE-family HTH domain
MAGMSLRPDSLLKMARRRARLTQRELARRSGVPQPTVSRIEAGRISPGYELLDRLLGACGIELVTVDRPTEGDVDRTLIRGSLALSPAQRLARVVEAWNNTAAFRGSAS